MRFPCNTHLGINNDSNENVQSDSQTEQQPSGMPGTLTGHDKRSIPEIKWRPVFPEQVIADKLFTNLLKPSIVAGLAEAHATHRGGKCIFSGRPTPSTSRLSTDAPGDSRRWAQMVPSRARNSSILQALPERGEDLRPV